MPLPECSVFWPTSRVGKGADAGKSVQRAMRSPQVKLTHNRLLRSGEFSFQSFSGVAK